MYLTNKYFHPINFLFASVGDGNQVSVGAEKFILTVEGSESDIYRLRLTHRTKWPGSPAGSEIHPPADLAEGRQGSSSSIQVSRRGEIRLSRSDGGGILRSISGEAFGICGQAWVFQFSQEPAMQFYGLGEKSAPFERSGRTYKFWNTDALSDFPACQVWEGEYDPDYISVPYLIIKRRNEYAGILIDNPFPSVISLPHPGNPRRAPFQIHKDRSLYLGAEDGTPSIYILYGPSLAALTRKFHQLVGVPPAPPLWALGYHQSRWGYRSIRELGEMAETFERHRFPVDGLFLDIDYMRGFRVFTFDLRENPAPRRELDRLRRRGYRAVPILDPGVKKEEGFDVYESGRREDIFCKNPASGEFTGVVWPGFTVFPDFSLPRGRAWWAEWVRRFADLGFEGVWIDMNDPSTGAIECVGMLFQDGAAPHGAYHNQYALLMARATREGLLAAHPHLRPFIVSRSGFTGSQRYCAHWTGDSCSTYANLRHVIGKSLNMALSGMSFNGGDVGGFLGDVTEELLLDWFKASFLLPFFRNHTATDTRRQEPWAFSRKALRILRYYARLRYKLLPYLYNLFLNHAESGDAVIRPLFYDFPDSPGLPLGAIDDQFLLGPFILHAPFVREGEAVRRVTLPAGSWYRADQGKWLEGGRVVQVPRLHHSTPLFLKEGAIVPLQRGVAMSNRKDLSSIELYLFFTKDTKGSVSVSYACDDGETFDYLNGERSRYEIEARVRRGELELSLECTESGFGAVEFTPVTTVPFRGMRVKAEGTTQRYIPVKKMAHHFGCQAPFYFWKRRR